MEESIIIALPIILTLLAAFLLRITIAAARNNRAIKELYCKATVCNDRIGLAALCGAVNGLSQKCKGDGLAIGLLWSYVQHRMKTLPTHTRMPFPSCSSSHTWWWWRPSTSYAWLPVSVCALGDGRAYAEYPGSARWAVVEPGHLWAGPIEPPDRIYTSSDTLQEPAKQ